MIISKKQEADTSKLQTGYDMKTCTKCKIEKELTDFHINRARKDGLCTMCKECLRSYSLNYNHTHGNLKEKKLEYYYTHKEQQQKKHKDWVTKNRASQLEYKKKYQAKHKKEIHDKRSKKYFENPKLYLDRKETWRKNNLNKAAAYVTRRYHSETDYRLPIILRARIKAAIRNNSKKEKTFALLGCTIEFLKSHLQKTAIQNGYMEFNINNYSGREYHIDHIIPCDSFDLSNIENQKKCFHYSNMQILDSRTNVIKSNKLAA